MNKFCWIVAFIFFTGKVAVAQQVLPAPDKSGMDQSYCPNNFPLLKIQDKASEPLLARVTYSRPKKDDRNVFGDLIEYRKVWRLGANEATEIEFYQPVKFGAVSVKKGRYTMYAVPGETKWTIILNKETDTWGSFKYDVKKDVARIEVPVQQQTNIAEYFTIIFDKSAKGYDLQFYWDNVKISVPIAM